MVGLPMIHSLLTKSYQRLLLSALLVLALPACMMGNFSDNLTRAILDQNDPQIVHDGAPAYLLLIDSFVAGDPHDVDMLRAGATLYATYAAVFAEDEERARSLADRAWSYGRRALCEEAEFSCGMEQRSFEKFQRLLKRVKAPHLETFYAYTVSWMVRIKADAGNWGALADLPKVEAALSRIVEIDESYQSGGAHLYLGILNALRPPSLGGRPEVGRAHFERALQLSEGRDLGVKVEYARTYARLVYDRELHDRLLHEVLEGEAQVPGLVLKNILAKRDARRLLDSGDDYF